MPTYLQISTSIQWSVEGTYIVQIHDMSRTNWTYHVKPFKSNLCSFQNAAAFEHIQPLNPAVVGPRPLRGPP